MKWFRYILTKYAQMQHVFQMMPVNENVYTFTGTNRVRDPDGQYRCFFCNAIVPDPDAPVVKPIKNPDPYNTNVPFFYTEKDRPWKIVGKTDNYLKPLITQKKIYSDTINNIIQECLISPDTLEENDGLYKWNHHTISYMFASRGIYLNSLDGSVYNLLDNFLPGSQDKNIAIKQISNPAFKTNLLNKIMKNSQIISEQIEKPLCDECCLNKTKECRVCNELFTDDDILNVDDEWNFVCKNCGTTCEKCEKICNNDETQFLIDDSGPYCVSCYAELERKERKYNKNNYDAAFYTFEQNHPELIGILEKAKKGEPLSPDAYIAIFDELEWQTSYGGKRWAEIARTWKKLIPLTDIKTIMENIKQAISLIDHAFDLQHNTNSLFTKSPEKMKTWLLKALDAKRDLPPANWYNEISSEIKKFLNKSNRYQISGAGTPTDFDRTETKLYRENKEVKRKAINDIFNSLQKFFIGESLKKVNFYKLTPQDFENTKLDFIAPILTNKYMSDPVWGDFISACVDIFSQKYDIPVSSLINLSNVSITDAEKELGSERVNKIINEARNKIQNIENVIGTISKSINYHSKKFGLTELENKDRLEKINEWLKTIKNSRLMQRASKIDSIQKLAQLTQNNFFDFYAITTIDCDQWPTNEKRYCIYMQAYCIHKIVNDLVNVFQKACTEEALHVNNALDFEEG